MDEQAGFEAHGVLAPRRKRASRLLLLAPVIALAAIGAAGLVGPHADRPTAALATVSPSTVLPSAAASTTPPATPTPHPPSTVLGLEVQRLEALDAAAIDPDLELAVAGWYATTSISGCPELAAIYREGQLPYLRGDEDKLAFCVRSGVLYAAEPDPGAPPTEVPRGGPARDPTLRVLPVTVAIGVVMPPEIEVVGAASTEIVVLGRFVRHTPGCVFLRGCGGDFIVDHVAWTAVARA